MAPVSTPRVLPNLELARETTNCCVNEVAFPALYTEWAVPALWAGPAICQLHPSRSHGQLPWLAPGNFKRSGVCV